MAARRTDPVATRRQQERDYRQPPKPLRRRGEVCVASGYGVKIAVQRGRLLVEDGFASLVVLGHAGYLSLEAIRWLADQGVPFLHLDADVHLLACSATGTPDARLRRAQALAATTKTGGCDRPPVPEREAGWATPGAQPACAAGLKPAALITGPKPRQTVLKGLLSSRTKGKEEAER